MLDVHHIQRMKPGQMVSCYLTAAYCYYHLDISPLTDYAFDLLARQLLACWDEVDHIHKHLITKDELLMGTLLLAEDKYPSRIRSPIPVAFEDGRILRWEMHAARLYYDRCVSGEMAKRLEPHLNPVGTVAKTPTIEQLDLFEKDN